jgi:3-phosphoshikimate 1-carboxyvinyltransferase
MRFLTAFLSIQEGKTFVLDGSSRMRQRPIGILVDALRQIGATIDYIEAEGYPPLQITGQKLEKNSITIDASVSSQYISALLLIGAALPKGININLEGKNVSKPYILMTLSLLNQLEIETEISKNKIVVLPQKSIRKKKFIIESDWSSASYFYAKMAVSQEKEMHLKYYWQDSLQGDSQLVGIFEKLGVKTAFLADHTIKLSKIPDFSLAQKLSFDLLQMPDIAQTLAVTCLALQIDCNLYGLQTLRIKETDRLLALKTEIEKLGATVIIDDDSLQLINKGKLKNNISIATYEDHRMAMSFAVLQEIVRIEIENKDVVKKSFPNFWELFD